MPALIFDLDGTLVDSVYEHVAAWHRAFADHHIELPAFEYHKRVGMTGSALVGAISDAFELGLDESTRAEIAARHAAIYKDLRHHATPVPGVRDLWNILESRKLQWAIATSASPDDASVLLKKAGVPSDAVVITKEAGAPSKPSPQPFARAAEKLGVELAGSMIVGDAVWDMLSARRAGAFGIGVLTGGYSAAELTNAGAANCCPINKQI